VDEPRGAGKAVDLGPERVAALDHGDMLDAITSLPRQLTEAYASARDRLKGMFEGAGRAAPPARPAGLVVCGMGGSAIGADLVLACLPELPIPAAVVRGYELPAWGGPSTLMIAISYSGDTDETLACTETALSRGCRPVCIASGGRLAALAEAHGLPHVRVPGGLQPRAAVGYLAAPLLASLESAGLVDTQRADVAEAAGVLREGNIALRPEAPEGSTPAKTLARRLFGRQAVVYGAGLTVSAARRWKGQINENAKAPAFWNELPELDHNELMGWTSLPLVSEATLAVFLEDVHGDARLLRRVELTAAHLAAQGLAVERVSASGTARLARVLSLVQFGDYVSFYLALLYGVDPTPVAPIRELKARLAGG
jgi:glucose/mannose-6-phosphate isomerase